MKPGYSCNLYEKTSTKTFDCSKELYSNILNDSTRPLKIRAMSLLKLFAFKPLKPLQEYYMYLYLRLDG